MKNGKNLIYLQLRNLTVKIKFLFLKNAIFLFSTKFEIRKTSIRHKTREYNNITKGYGLCPQRTSKLRTHTPLVRERRRGDIRAYTLSWCVNSPSTRSLREPYPAGTNAENGFSPDKIWFAQMRECQRLMDILVNPHTHFDRRDR